MCVVSLKLLYTMCVYLLALLTLQLMFGVCVMFALLIPSRVISFLFPSFLPLNLTLARYTTILIPTYIYVHVFSSLSLSSPLFCVVQLALFVRYSWSWFYFSLWSLLCLSMGTVVLDSSLSSNTGPGSLPQSCRAISHQLHVICDSTMIVCFYIL